MFDQPKGNYMVVDLKDIIRQAIPQTFGSDERGILQAYLDRFIGFEEEHGQIIRINLATAQIRQEQDLYLYGLWKEQPIDPAT